MCARRKWERDGHARSMCSFLRVPSPAAHPMQRRPDGTKRSGHLWVRHSQPVGPSGRATQEQESRPKGPGPSGVEARAVTASPGTRETPAMLEAGLLAASTSVRSRMTGHSLVDAVPGGQKYRQPPRYQWRRPSPASLVFLSGRLVLLPLQAERRKRGESIVACREGGKASTNTGR